MLFAMYVLGVPLSGFLAWVFSGAFHTADIEGRHFRRVLSAVAGFLWPLLLAGVVQMLAVLALVRVRQFAAAQTV